MCVIFELSRLFIFLEKKLLGFGLLGVISTQADIILRC